jgi:hypothetical protein
MLRAAFFRPQVGVATLTATCGSSSLSVGISSSSSPACAFAAPQGLSEQRRFLKFAKSNHGYHIKRAGYRKFPSWRRPIALSTRHASKISAPFHWKYWKASDSANFLPRENYVTDFMTGTVGVPRGSYATLQHLTSGVPITVMRFPTFYTFNKPSRWIIGSRLQQWVLPRALIVDEVAISKRQKLVYIKKGLLPKE